MFPHPSPLRMSTTISCHPLADIIGNDNRGLGCLWRRARLQETLQCDLGRAARIARRGRHKSKGATTSHLLAPTLLPAPCLVALPDFSGQCKIFALCKSLCSQKRSVGPIDPEFLHHCRGQQATPATKTPSDTPKSTPQPIKEHQQRKSKMGS